MKTARTIIINGVMQHMKDQSPHTGGFVKQDAKTGAWFAVSDATARITVSQAFRDADSGKYKSSKQSKQQKRQKFKFGANGQTVTTFNGFGALSIHDLELPVKLPSSSSNDCTSTSQGLQLSLPKLQNRQDLAYWTIGSMQDLSTTAQERSATTLDLETLWSKVSNHSSTGRADDNPFEPTPIAPAAEPQITSSTLLLPEPISEVSSNNPACDGWENQIRCGALWQGESQSAFNNNNQKLGVGPSICGHEPLDFQFWNPCNSFAE